MSDRIPFPFDQSDPDPANWIPQTGQYYTDDSDIRWQYNSFKKRWSLAPLPSLSQAYITDTDTPGVDSRNLLWIDPSDGTQSYWDAAADAWVVTSGSGGAGDDGEDGDTGIQGIQGERGLQGLTGIQGIQGVQGLQGFQGIQGEEGAAGVGIVLQGALANFTAINGEPHVLGHAWLATDTGVIWYSDGSAPWISLGVISGPQGIQGIQGIDGDQGTQGVQGPAGPIIREVVSTSSTSLDLTHTLHQNVYVRLTGTGAVVLNLPVEDGTNPWSPGDNITFRVTTGNITSVTFNPANPVAINGSSAAADLVEDDTFILMYVGSNVWDYI